MQNDISLEEVKRDTTLREEKLQKMKSNIEALQLNMAKKKIMGKNKEHNKNIPEQVAAGEEYFREEKDKSPKHHHLQTEFGYNSTLFRNINNDSQPIMNNGSALSNFSSVSNINHLLNHHLHRDHPQEEQAPKGKDPLLEEIDRILQKTQKAHKLPNKAIEKVMQQSNLKLSGVIPEEPQETSKIHSYRGDVSARNKLDEYKLMINQLNLTEVDRHEDTKGRGDRKKEQKEKRMPQTDNYYDFGEELDSYRSHKKEASSLTVKSEDEMFDLRSKPPTPASKQIPKNAVQRQKMLIKESVQQYKKLQTESSHEILDRSEIDFQLSDEEDHRPEDKNHLDGSQQSRIRNLRKEKDQLEAELLRIEEQLESLERDL